MRALSDELLGSSTVAQRIRDSVAEAAGTRHLSVLITGPTGVGKSLIARAIHRASHVGPDGAFELLNCAGYNLGWFDAHLYGHEQGAYTGAIGRQKGACERAGRGTVFLDEIGDLPLDLQGRLLDLLDRGAFRRVGGTTELPLEARLVAATNVDLKKAMDAGRFRVDLYHRWDVLIDIPPLSQRPEDVATLAVAFATAQGEPAAFAPDALDALASNEWRGNVRELEKHVMRLLRQLRERPIRAVDIPLTRTATESPDAAYKQMALQLIRLGGNPLRHVEEVARAVKCEIVARHGGVVRAAARELGVSHSTLRSHLGR
jgi:DNA-binding NtrC family response regulator